MLFRGKKSSSSEDKRKKRKSKNEEYEYVSDDERLYGDKDTPDPDSREYFYDEIDEFHAKRDKVSYVPISCNQGSWTGKCLIL